MKHLITEHTEKKVQEIEIGLRHYLTQDDYSLYGGLAGMSLFYYHFHKRFETNESESLFWQSLEAVIESFERDDRHFTFCNGTIGKLYAISYFIQNGVLDENIVSDELIDMISAYASSSMKANNCDILHGGLGALMFLNEIPKRSLEHRLSICTEFVSKIKNNNSLALWEDHFKKTKNFDLGLAHGNAGFCILLCRCRDFDSLITPDLIGKVLESIKQFKLGSNAKSIYPYSSIEGKEGSRLAWCYGDLGIASAFWQAGKAFHRSEWKDEAIQILMHSANRFGLDENMIRDAGLCHGAAGVMHIFRRFYFETGIKAFEASADYWQKQTLDLARFENGIAGYKSFHFKKGYIVDASFLEGATGTGLALLSALTDDLTDLAWDRSLLLA